MYLQLHIKIKKINLSKLLQVQYIMKTRWKQGEKQRKILNIYFLKNTIIM